MKAKNRYFVFALFLAFTLVLAACGTAQTTETAATAVPGTTAGPAATGEVATPQPGTAEATEAGGTGREFLWDTRLRQAVAAAIDREVQVDLLFAGRNLPAYHMVPPNYPFFTEPFLNEYGVRDLDRSRTLLAEAGYSEDNPFVFDLWWPVDHFGTNMADVMQLVKEQLEETEMMQVNLKTKNWEEYIEAGASGELPFFIQSGFPEFVDPDNWLSTFASCTSSPGLGTNYCSEEMDSLLQQAATTVDEAERAQLYQQIGELYAQEVPSLPLFWEPEFIVYRDGVEGISIGASFEFLYNTLSFEAEAQPAAGNNDTILIGTTDAIRSLDPADAAAAHDWELIKNTGLTLMGYTTGTNDLVPSAAASEPEVSDGGLTYTFTLRDDLAFPDGTPVTAQDYVRSFNRIATLGGDVADLVTRYVESVEAPDDETVIYHLTGTYGFFPAVTATAPFVVANPAIFSDDELNKLPATLGGTGPYQIVSITEGEQVVLEEGLYLFNKK